MIAEFDSPNPLSSTIDTYEVVMDARQLMLGMNQSMQLGLLTAGSTPRLWPVRATTVSG